MYNVFVFLDHSNRFVTCAAGACLLALSCVIPGTYDRDTLSHDRENHQPRGSHALALSRDL